MRRQAARRIYYITVFTSAGAIRADMSQATTGFLERRRE